MTSFDFTGANCNENLPADETISPLPSKNSLILFFGDQHSRLLVEAPGRGRHCKFCTLARAENHCASRTNLRMHSEKEFQTIHKIFALNQTRIEPR